MTPEGGSSSADLQVGGEHAAIPTHGAADANSTGLNTAGGKNMGEDAGMNGESVAGGTLLKKLGDAARWFHRRLRKLVRPGEHQRQEDLESGMTDGTAANVSDPGPRSVVENSNGSGTTTIDVPNGSGASTRTGGPHGAPGRPVTGTTDGAANMSALGPRPVFQNSNRSGTITIDISYPDGSGAPARISIAHNHRDNALPYLTKITLVFLAQLAAALLTTVLTGSRDNWFAITLLLACLMGFILILISVSRICGASISSVISKVSFATVVGAIIICIAVALPIPAMAKIGVIALASLPALIAVIRAPAEPGN